MGLVRRRRGRCLRGSESVRDFVAKKVRILRTLAAIIKKPVITLWAATPRTLSGANTQFNP